MKLLRVQVPNFRALQDVDISFEKEFHPQIFPLGSQNGGGKSTLLQLIFILLHCYNDPEKIPFLKNMLYGFNISDASNERLLAVIEIWDSSRNIELEFIAYKDNSLKNFLKNNKELRFSLPIRKDSLNIKIIELKRQAQYLQDSLNRLNKIKNIENEHEKYRYLIDIFVETDIEISLTELKDIDIIKNAEEKLQKQLKLTKSNLNHCSRHLTKLEVSVQEVVRYLREENLIYICNYSANGSNEEDEVLLCRVNNIDVTETENFLKLLSTKVFMAAPTGQIFLFLSPKSRNQLFKRGFKKQGLENDYYSDLELAKLKLAGFFTYDFLSVDILIDTFKAARDEDFKEAVKTGEYGNNYKALLIELNIILGNKKLNVIPDLSGVNFKQEQEGKLIDLYPEDLSHGELKRLSIYMWLKHYNIENAIVLMDEIEIAFHPDWQYQIISDLNQWSPTNQYILATHSYELCQALTPAHVKELEPKLLKREIKN